MVLYCSFLVSVSVTFHLMYVQIVFSSVYVTEWQHFGKELSPRLTLHVCSLCTNLPTRGNSLKILKRRSRLKVRASVFSNRVVDVWNSLPNNVVTAPSLNSFKSRLNNHWHGHVLKFRAKCYIPGETVASNFQRTYPNGSLEVA